MHNASVVAVGECSEMVRALFLLGDAELQELAFARQNPVAVLICRSLVDRRFLA
jgi:hypothetical protein